MLKNTKLSKKMIALILAGASSLTMLDEFLDEKEGNSLTAYRDAGGVVTICRGVTKIAGKPIPIDLKLTESQCSFLNEHEAEQALAIVDKYITYPLNDVAKVGVASFCAYNIGIGKCKKSTFFRLINAGDLQGACNEIPRWIRDGGKDCRLTKGQPNGCYGQVIRREQEQELCLWLTKNQ